MSIPSPLDSAPPCPSCGRVAPYCVCEFVVPIKSRSKILILQHPQEPGVDIGTVPIIQAAFPNCIVKTGLSWPNLKRILGPDVEHQRWGVLYLGSVHVENLPNERNLFVVDKKGEPRHDQDEVLQRLEGFIILDGTWSQAKTLWWRNAWLLKLPRLVLKPKMRSAYDKIRKEPRKGCLSTVESVGEVLAALEHRSDVHAALEKPLSELINRLATLRPRQARTHQRRPYWQRRSSRSR